MKDNKDLKFAFYLILQITIVLGIVGCLALGLLMYNSIFIKIAIAITVVYIFIRVALKDRLAEARQDKDYDEFGRNKKLKSTKQVSAEERREIDLQKLANMEQILSSTMLKRMTKEGSPNPKKDMDSMVALQGVKEKMEEMVARMEFETEGCKKDRKGRPILKDKLLDGSTTGKHMIFYGSAGVGKTTIARIMTGFLYQYGYIKENKMIECDGNFLKAGQDTATKTSLIIHEAYGGVLFIDEAYALGEGSFGKEAVATLIKEMEDNRDKFVVILAGYTKEMKEFLSINSGFESRIKEYISFPDYNSVELRSIFVDMANQKNFAVSGEALERFDLRMEKERRKPAFGNGRTVRNVLDEVLDKHALNYSRKILTEEQKYLICEQDVDVVEKKRF